MRKYGICFNMLALCSVICFSAMIPQPLLAQSDKGIELFNSQSYTEAEAKLSAALKDDPGNTTARYYLGLSLLQQGKYAEALKELKTVKSEQEKASQRSRPAVPSVYQIDIALAQAYLWLGRYEEAWPKLESARVEDSSSSDVFLFRGIYYYKQKELSKAVTDLEKAISLDPKKAYAYYYVGYAYYDQGKPDRMVEVFKIFLQLNPGAPEAAEVKKLIDANC